MVAPTVSEALPDSNGVMSTAARTKLVLQKGAQAFRDAKAAAAALATSEAAAADASKQQMLPAHKPVPTPARADSHVTVEGSEHASEHEDRLTQHYSMHAEDVEEESLANDEEFLDEGVSVEVRSSPEVVDTDMADTATAPGIELHAKEQVAAMLGQPKHWGQPAEAYLSPDMQVPRKSKAAKKCKEPTAGKKAFKRPAKAVDQEKPSKRAKKSDEAEPKKACLPKSKPCRSRKSKACPKPSPKKVMKKAPKSKASAKSKPAAAEKGADYKAKQSRKSSAYHKAFKQAKDDGKDLEECRELARAATRLQIYWLC